MTVLSVVPSNFCGPIHHSRTTKKFVIGEHNVVAVCGVSPLRVRARYSNKTQINTHRRRLAAVTEVCVLWTVAHDLRKGGIGKYNCRQYHSLKTDIRFSVILFPMFCFLSH